MTVYENELLPLINQIQAICERENIPAIIGCQLFVDDELQGVKVGVQTFFNAFTTEQFIVAAKILRGEITYNPEQVVQEAIGEAIEEHVKVCVQCAERVATIREETPEITDEELIAMLAAFHLTPEPDVNVIDGVLHINKENSVH